MVPKPGYWRYDNKTDKFFTCLYDLACLGGEDPFNPMGNCEKGYEGNLCHHCSENYSRKFDKLCYECPDETTGLLLLVLTIIIVIVIFIMMISSGIKSAYKPKSMFSIYIKVA